MSRRPYRQSHMNEENSQEFIGIPEATHSDEEEEFDDSKDYHDFNRHQSGQEMFDGLIEKLESKFEPTMASQIDRLKASTLAFRKIANGYTQKKYLER